MKIVLSQKIDTKSSYQDTAFQEYHYPARYRNQIHTGDVFVYYQGNRYVKEQRYYFGMGMIGDIKQIDSNNYYAELINTKKFNKKVPIYMPDGSYIEQLGCSSGRSCPPWQSSIRPITEEAYSYILSQSGLPITLFPDEQLSELKAALKESIKEYFVRDNASAIDDIVNYAKALSLIDTRKK